MTPRRKINAALLLAMLALGIGTANSILIVVHLTRHVADAQVWP